MHEPLKRPLGPAANVDDPGSELSEAELLALEAVYCSHGDTVHYTNPPKIFESCEGSFLYDLEGRQYLDLQMWYSAVNFGYKNERLNEAVRRQLDRLPQVASQYLHREKIELAAMLAKAAEQKFGLESRASSARSASQSQHWPPCDCRVEFSRQLHILATSCRSAQASSHADSQVRETRRSPRSLIRAARSSPRRIAA